jgi:hypothetical protein
VGDPDTGIVLCCETISSRPKPPMLISLLDGNRDTNIHLATLLTAEWLIWARYGDQTGTVVTGAKFQVIKVNAFVTRHSKDMELEVSGFLTDTKEYVRGNLEMGSDIAAQTFCEAAVAAVLKAKPPAKNKFFGLISG